MIDKTTQGESQLADRLPQYVEAALNFDLKKLDISSCELVYQRLLVEFSLDSNADRALDAATKLVAEWILANKHRDSAPYSTALDFMVQRQRQGG